MAASARGQCLDRCPIRRIERDADARGRVNIDTRHAHRGLQGVNDALGDKLRVLASDDRIDEDDELIAPDPSHSVYAAHDA